MADGGCNTDLKVCTGCGLSKLTSEYGYSRKSNGVPLLRAQCRSCYNAKRRRHYWTDGVKDEKQAKRREYEHKSGLAARRKERRRSDLVLREQEKAARDRYRSNPEVSVRLSDYRAKYRERPEARAKTLLLSSRKRAEKKCIPFSLRESWVLERVSSGVCELTGLPFDYGPAPNGWRYNPNSPSIDRIDAKGGYTEDNCRVVLTALNNALSQYGDGYFAMIAEAFLRRRLA